MVKIEGRRIIRAPMQRVFQLVGRLEAHPRVTGLWLTADLLERKANALTVHYRGYFGGMPVESVQRATLFPPKRVEFTQTRGGLRAFRGQYALQPIDGDTELSLAVEADVGIPLISEVSARRVLLTYVERSLEKFKLLAELDLPRVQRRARQVAPAPAAPPSTPPAEPQPSSAAASQPAPVRKRRRRRRRKRRHPAARNDGKTGGERGNA